MILLPQWILILVIVATLSLATPMPQNDDSGSEPLLSDTTSVAVDTPTVTTVSLSGYPSDAANGPGDLGVPISGTSYFAVAPDCYGDTRNVDYVGFANRGLFYEQAYKDAVAIADQAQKWPQYGTDASDLYFGTGAENVTYAANITANIKAAANWDHSQFGFDNYIVLTCNDPYEVCGGKLGSDTRPIACYVNNTKSWWWNKSVISCCSPFFTVATIDQQFELNKNVDPANLDLRYLQTSGSYLLHEMMHTLEITGTHPKTARPHLVDLYFTGTGKRIYGPVDVAKAAQNLGIKRTQRNADSYAQFASAMFWKDIFGELPKPQTSQPAPADWTQLITDNDLNYVTQVLPQPPAVCAGTPSTNPSVGQPYAQSLISQFCSFVTSQNITVTSTTYNYNPVGYAAGNDVPDSGNTVWLSVSFDPVCNANTTYTIDEDDCNFYLGITLNGCNTDTIAAKFGGQVEANCAIWNMTTRFGSDEEPPNGYVSW